MENEMDSEDFDRAIGPTPPSTVDIERIITRERRRAWLQAGPLAATAAGITAIAVGAVALLSHTDAPVPPAIPVPSLSSQHQTQTPTETQTYCPGNSPTVPPAPENAEVAATRLSAVLKTAVLQRAAAGTVLEQNSAAVYPAGTTHGPFEFFHVSEGAQPQKNGCRGGADHLETRATLVGGMAKGSVWAVMGRLGGDTSPSTDCSAPVMERTSCEVSTGPHNETIVATTLTAGSVKSYRVDVSKPDGTAVVLTAENVAGDGKSDTNVTSTNPPLTHQQLTEIALAPAMTLYP
jgi:hypothetical protein